MAESDWQDYSEAVAEYEKIWAEDGEKIVNAWEKQTSLKFKETEINASVIEGKSFSHPLTLRNTLPSSQKRITLTHELGHRLLYFRVEGMARDSLTRHKFLYLVLGDVLTEVYGAGALEEARASDKKLQDQFGEDKYTKSWDFALAFSQEERQKKFQAILSGDLSSLK